MKTVDLHLLKSNNTQTSDQVIIKNQSRAIKMRINTYQKLIKNLKKWNSLCKRSHQSSKDIKNLFTRHQKKKLKYFKREMIPLNMMEVFTMDKKVTMQPAILKIQEIIRNDIKRKVLKKEEIDLLNQRTHDMRWNLKVRILRKPTDQNQIIVLPKENLMNLFQVKWSQKHSSIQH